MNTFWRHTALVLICFCLTACKSAAEQERQAMVAAQQAAASPDASAHWLQGNEAERWAQTARHFRGLDQAMVEIGYRYGELAWAGQDQNWDYAAYQLEKIQLAMALALERRPKREASAAVFLKQDLPAMQQVIAARDTEAFPQALNAFTQSCNACHVRENVAFFNVAVPTQRLSPISPTQRGK